MTRLEQIQGLLDAAQVGIARIKWLTANLPHLDADIEYLSNLAKDTQGTDRARLLEIADRIRESMK